MKEDFTMSNCRYYKSEENCFKQFDDDEFFYR